MSDTKDSKKDNSDVQVSLEATKEDALLDEIDEDTKAKQKAKSQKSEDNGKKTKGRGFGTEREKEVAERYSGKYGEFEVIGEDKTGALKCMNALFLNFFSGGRLDHHYYRNS